MTTLPAKLENVSTEQLMELTGQSSGMKIDFPRLAVVRDPGEDDTHPLPMGYFAVSQNGLAVYGKPILFRPFINCYQYSIYDSAVKLTTNRSIIIKNFQEEAFDEQGGISCGKVSQKKREHLTPAQQAEQKKITCYRIMYGLATFKGRTSDGQETDVTAVPVKLRLRGTNFMAVQDALEGLSKKKIAMITAQLLLSTERNKDVPKGVVAYSISAVPEERTVVLTDADWSILQEFQAAINEENRVIVAKYKSARKGIEAPLQEQKIIDALDSDLNDSVDDL